MTPEHLDASLVTALGLDSPLLEAFEQMPVPMWVVDRLGHVRWRRPKPRLTPRQEEILELLADGRSTSEMSRHLNISEDTVRNTFATCSPSSVFVLGSKPS